MKKKMLGIIAFAAIAAVAGWNYTQNMDNINLSDLALENVEALAGGENINPDCPNGCISGGGGCFCYVDYPQYREASW